MLCTAFSFRGVIVLGNETYGLEPVPQSATNEHLLYRLKDVQTSEAFTCGVVRETSSTQSHSPFEPGQSLTSLLRVRMLITVTRIDIEQTGNGRSLNWFLCFFSVCFYRGSAIYQKQVMWSWCWLLIISGWVHTVHLFMYSLLYKWIWRWKKYSNPYLSQSTQWKKYSVKTKHSAVIIQKSPSVRINVILVLIFNFNMEIGCWL